MKIQKLSKHSHPGGSTSSSMSSLLYSEDIITEIFHWLPTKSLVRFKRLSKRWHFLICHKDSYFRRNYLSTLSTRRKILGGGNNADGDDDSATTAIMAGFFYQKVNCEGFYDRVRFLPITSTQFKTYHFLPGTQFEKYNIQQRGGGEKVMEIINDVNPLCSLDKSLDKFLLTCLHKDPAHQMIFIVASSNGFLLCSLEMDYSKRYYVINPVTMEWLALPKFFQPIKSSNSRVGFVCKGDYPSLDLVEYTIVRLSWLKPNVQLLFEFFSNAGDNQWIDYTCSCESLPVQFSFTGELNTLVVSSPTSTNSDDDQGGGIVVYFLVRVWRTLATAIVVYDSNKDDSLQMIETPGPDRGRTVIGCLDYIRKFDAGVIHYVRFQCNTDFEFWVLNVETREWCIKHKASLKTMMKGYPWSTDDVDEQLVKIYGRYHIHAFHPMNPNLIFLSLNTRMVCYNIETGTIEMVYDFCAQKMLDYYCHYVYQWPCWPPLL